MGGGCVEGQELGGATTPGRVGADGHDRSFVEEGVQCLAELRTRRRGEGEVGDDTVLEGGEGVACVCVGVAAAEVWSANPPPPANSA